MSLQVVPVGYGVAAHDELARLVQAAKAADPLAPVTVVVPSNYVGVAARRRLAREHGIIGVTFVTVYRLAELLGAARLADEGRRPVSNPVLLAAIQEELRERAGVFAPVREHPATEEALVAAHKLVADLSDDGLARLAAASRQAHDVVDLHRRVRARLADWFDEADLLGAASAELDRGHPVAGGLGQVVVLLPQELSRRAAAFLARVALDRSVTVLAGLTGAEGADRGVRRSLSRLGAAAPEVAAVPARAGPLHVITTSDADEEVRAAVRAVVAAARAGTPFERMAIVHPGSDHYATLVHQQLEAAGLVANGAAPDRLADRTAGRTLLDLLRLAQRSPDRAEVFRILAGAPLRLPGGGFVPSVVWERLSREAGVVGTDAHDWDQHLSTFAAGRHERAKDSRQDDLEALARRQERDAEQALALRDFVLGLFSRLGELAAARGWRALAEQAAALSGDLLGREHQRQAWPPEEQEAASKVEAALERLAHLDQVSADADLDRFTRALALELDADLGRRGRFGDGILVGPLGLVLGLELDLVVVLGLAEGILPTRQRDDALLPDRDRLAVDGELPLAVDRQQREHRQLLAAVAAADRVVLTVPRGDLRRTTEHVASRWLLQLVQQHHGERLWSDDLFTHQAPWLTQVPSFAAGLRTALPATDQEARLAVVLAGQDLAGDVALGRARQAQRARLGDAFSAHDGNLAGATVISPTAAGQAVSPTRLEAWAICPYAYFVRYLLRVEPVDNPEALLRLSPLEQGTLVHRAMEGYVRARIADGTASVPTDEALLHRHFELACRDAETRGVTGRPVLWQHQREQLWRHLLTFARADGDRGRQEQAQPLVAELGFGFTTEPIVVPVGGERHLRFRGSIDRVDRAGDGHLVVTDYKYSSTYKYQDLSPENPTANGALLQLPIYAMAASETFDQGRLPLAVTARYAFAKPGSDGRLPKHKELVVDDVVLAEWRAALAVIVQGIERGHFPARPGDDSSRFAGFISCPACDPDGMGTADQQRRWARLQRSPELADYVALLGLAGADDDPDGVGGDGQGGVAMAELIAPDAEQRERITAELDATLFVEAGAGSGKTRSLVDRVHALVVHAGVPMREIAAITFTDKAAAELRDRVRRRLEEAAGEAGPTDMVASERATVALTELDGAAVCTLHAFAQRLLTEHPLAAGLPPRVEVADELTSQIAFEERWAAFLDELLDVERLQATPGDEQALLVLLDSRRPLEALRDVALEFERNWDLVAEHVLPVPAPELHRPDATGLAAGLAAVAAERFQGEATDRLVLVLEQMDVGAQQLVAATDLREQMQVLARLGDLTVKRTGNKQNWRSSRWSSDLDALRQLADDALEACREAERLVSETCLRRLAARLAVVTQAAAEARRAQGRLAFHDLLVLARELLRHPGQGSATRRLLHDRYTRLLLDEFQDTDPIQIDIARLLAADPAQPAGGSPAALEPLPGRLFFVGDPKQSIYRFRRADIGTFLDTRAAVTDEPVRLSANFRTTAAVVAWVNAVFSQLIVESPRAQPAYQELVAVRSTPLAGPGVVPFGGAHDDKPDAAELRAREVADVVQLVQAAIDHWEVEDPETGEVRAARHGDIAILLPTRTVLDVLEDGLEAAAIPYRTESSSLAYATREVRDLLLALQAVDDPTDELALVSTLRSPLFGCSDVDLYRWRTERGGRWNLVGGDLPPHLGDGSHGTTDDPVHDALTELRALAAERHWLTPSVLLERLVRTRRVLELAGTGRRSRDVWRRIRYLLDQARAWQEAGGASLRAYVTWAYRQASDSIRVTEAVLPETDHDAVRIMTVHAAKGLEFPVVIVAGLTTRPRGGRKGVDVLWTPHGPELRLDDTFVTRDYETTRALDEQLDEHERRRLLYVACTRARDHLAVSTHRKVPARGSTATPTLADLVAEACAALPLTVRPDPELLRPRAAPAPGPPVASVGPPPLDLAAWQREHTALLTRASRPRTAAATSFAAHHDPEAQGADDPGLAKGGVDLDLPPWHKGRYGTAIGRAVHAVLQTVDLATGEGVEAASAAQAAAEGVLGRERLIAALVRSALRTAIVHEAVATEHWREVLVAAPIGDTLLEGYLDLLLRTDEGLVVVDYKTDQPGDDEGLDQRVALYRPQLAAYALAVEAVTGERVRRAVLVFCSATTVATEREVPRLSEAMAEVAGRLRAETAGTPPPLPV